MKKELLEQLKDLEKSKLKETDGILVQDDSFELISDNESFRVDKYKHNGKNYFLKDWEYEFSIQNLATTQMYNDLGILTPPSYLIKKPENNYIKVISQDITSLDKLFVTIASEIIPYKQDVYSPKERQRNHDKWEILTDERIRRHFQKHLTPECFEELINLFLADELRTESDRHPDNFFFYKSEGSEKYNGVIPIDNDLTRVLFTEIYNGSFEEFIKHKYQTFNPSSSIDSATFPERINNIISLLERDLLTSNNIKFLKSVVAYQFPELIKETCNKYTSDHFTKLNNYQQTVYEPFARLWEYINNTLGKELEQIKE